MQDGRQTESGELGVLVGQIRRILSATAVRAQAECLLSRLRNVGSGTGAANRRRQGVLREEVNWAMERGQVKSSSGKKLKRRKIAKLSPRSSSSWAEFSFIVSFSPPTPTPHPRASSEIAGTKLAF
jgi:hypothetical protein